MEKKEIIKLVGKDTVFEFQFMADSIMEYKTAIPQPIDGEYIHYKVSLFYEELKTIFRVDTLTGFLNDFQIFELIEIHDNTTKNKVLHVEQYITKSIL